MKNTLITSIAILLFSCTGHKTSENFATVKAATGDPFANSMVESEHFKKDVSDYCFVESKKGSYIFIPNGAFLDSRNKPVKGIIDIEIAEANDPSDLILSNLVLTDYQNIVRQKKAFFINATQNGRQLRINPETPVYIEISSNIKPLKLYHGIRDANGNMNWKDDTDPVRYLIPVQLEMLDFLPEGFRAAVESGLPYKNYKTATSRLVDSLYYSFSVAEKTSYSNMQMIALPLSGLLIRKLSNISKDTTYNSLNQDINPASIKVIRSRKFQNTLISTREFETRIQAIFRTCNNEILELYINNLNKNLWEIDSLAAEKLGKNHSLYETFRNFSSLKQTNVKSSGKQAEFLSQEFYRQRKLVEEELQKIKSEYISKKEKNENLTQKKIEDYKNLLQKRHEYRMHKFGFELTKTGWYNIAEKISLQEVKRFELNTVVKNGDSFDRTYVYIVNPKIKSIFALLANDKVHFQCAYQEDPDLLLLENQQINAVGIGYSGDRLAYSITQHTQQPITNIEFGLKYGDSKQLKNDLAIYTKGYSKENKILIDLEYKNFLFRESENNKKEELFMTKLLMKAFPCSAFVLEFRKSEMKEIFNSLSFLYDVPIKVMDKSINSNKLYGTFDVRLNEPTLDQAFKIISIVLNVEFKYHNNGYEVYMGLPHK